MLKHLILINFSAISSNLPASSRERTNAPHLYHGTSKVREESCRTCAVACHLRIRGPSIVELLVWMQETLLAQQILVVDVVENGRSGSVERGEIVVAACTRAIRFQRCGQRRIDVGLIVDTSSEGSTPCLAYSVRPWSKRELLRSLTKRMRTKGASIKKSDWS